MVINMLVHMVSSLTECQRVYIIITSLYSNTLPEHASVLAKYTHNLECIFHKFGDTKAVAVATAMFNLIDHPTLKGCSLFTSVSIGINKYLPAHVVDKDITMSIISVLKNQACSNDDEIMAHFCFPRLGITVPLCPGDAVLIFNLNEPHGLSSRCKQNRLIALGLANREKRNDNTNKQKRHVLKTTSSN